ncbi:hypothetical protein ANCDUO_20851 [Ancylostoma duodenale]|uniref:Uncharacterized protein n=1 Tax=Ancylostoma duodenale TaxID=51022 RepID=A0A0C2FKI2_9BILA|nr:hypothetical protein ANCDUO_20851 [Ancylostoma duodenale]
MHDPSHAVRLSREKIPRLNPGHMEEVFQPSVPPAMPYPAQVPQYSGQQAPYPGVQPTPPQHPGFQVPSQYPTIPQVAPPQAGYPTQLPPQPQPMGYPYPMPPQPVPVPQQMPLYQPYPGCAPMYIPAGTPYPPQPGMVVPGGYLPQQAVLQQSAPSAPTAPPIDLTEIEPHMVPAMQNMNIGR